MSSASERRVWMGRIKVTGAALLFVCVLVAALHFLPRLEGGPEVLTKAGESMPIQVIDVESDGSLEQDYILRQLDVPENANLLSVDLDAMKARIELIGQVRSAVVSRHFPDALEVRIKERKPIVRILAQRANGETLKLFVDEEGYVFESEHMDPKVARTLPFLDGVTLSKEEFGYSRIEGIRPLAELLSEAQTVAPHIYNAWRIVSLERHDRLITKGRAAKEVVFDRYADFRNQLGRLDYILDDCRSKRRGEIASVDLTLEDQVPVRFL
ncbi:FtsQ-type POTRA domain-containing protein [Pelagicoccus sp. SDUM812002]|nr:FtsQ-type POTRA domain-containing protein [Pelagicoccus sp. SDUM812002]